MTDVAARRGRKAAGGRWAASAIGALAGLLLLATPARASLGYEPAASNPEIPLHGEVAHGVAIDQESQRIYIAELTASTAAKEPGQVEQLTNTGTPTAASPFKAGDAAFSGVAVNPLTHGIYAAEFIITTPFGSFGESKIHLFSSTGTLGLQFATNNTVGTAPQLATDASGHVYFPSDTNDSVQVFDSSGALQETITCAGCTGGGFERPVSVAIDPAGYLYVVDIGDDRVLKFADSGPSYSFVSVLQSGRNAGAVGVDPSDGTVFVGGLDPDLGFHVVAYDSSGQQFDDFGTDLLLSPQFGLPGLGQIAVNASTHKVYVTDPTAKTLRVFEKVTINPPTATTDPASSVGQVTARLNATINPRYHALVDCHFEHTDQADFEANGYANATDLPCPSLLGGSTPTPIIASLSGLQPSTTYHFRVVTANNAGSATGGDRTFTTLPATPPTVVTQAAGSITQTAATLTGEVNPHGGTVTDCHFEYGPEFSFGTSVPCVEDVEPATTEVELSVKATGLTLGTAYQYRLVVTSNAGSVNGNEVEFTTLPPVPSVITGAASGVGQTVATIAGTIDPNGAPSGCQFEYGLTTAYGSTTGCTTDPGGGKGPVAESLALTGLKPGTTYHYRLVGSNAGGTTKGLDSSFTTLSPTTTDPPPLQPPPTPPTTTPPKPLKCKKGFRKAKVRGKLRCVKKKPKRHRR